MTESVGAFAIYRCIWDATSGILKLEVRNVLTEDSVDIVRHEVFTREEMLQATQLIRSCNVPIEVTGDGVGIFPASQTRH